MGKKFFIGLFVFFLLMILMTGTSWANLLVNPGFETGDLTGWTMGGTNGGYGVSVDGQSIPGVTYSSFLPSFQNVRSGNYAAYAVAAASNGEYVSFSQALLLSPGEYTASFYMGHDEGGVFGIGGAIDNGRLGIWIDGINLDFKSTYENNFVPGSSSLDFTLFDADFVSLGGTTAVEFRISGSGTARAGISVDDFSLESSNPVVPEPATMLLLGSGLLGLFGFKRKRKV
ncbi:MAG: PEP-CTERM sorting domain-containing protein [Candidatus Omnitrophica bacterium]|nr:PEP-CTERM sorting domain-containing protein [Candidatus Omnitrophota bacterium]